MLPALGERKSIERMPRVPAKRTCSASVNASPAGPRATFGSRSRAGRVSHYKDRLRAQIEAALARDHRREWGEFQPAQMPANDSPHEGRRTRLSVIPSLSRSAVDARQLLARGWRTITCREETNGTLRMRLLKCRFAWRAAIGHGRRTGH